MVYFIWVIFDVLVPESRIGPFATEKEADNESSTFH